MQEPPTESEILALGHQADTSPLPLISTFDVVQLVLDESGVGQAVVTDFYFVGGLVDYGRDVIVATEEIELDVGLEGEEADDVDG